MKDNLYHYRATVLRVVDGDTVDVMLELGFNVSLKERVRLYGINAPESRTRDKLEKVKGLASKDFVVEWTEDHADEIVIVTRIDKRGKYGRVLGTIMTESGENLNELMIKEGHAVEYFGGKRKR
jgi:micrococcal nuclease|tara:strand:- start:352 stop:723 length:372 start_codon:yes stop_codon:yes gene_type:complete